MSVPLDEIARFETWEGGMTNQAYAVCERVGYDPGRRLHCLPEDREIAKTSQVRRPICSSAQNNLITMSGSAGAICEG